MSEVSETFVQIAQPFRALAKGAGDRGYRLSAIWETVFLTQIPGGREGTSILQYQKIFMPLNGQSMKCQK